VNTTVSGNSVAGAGAGSENNQKYLGGGVFSLGIFASNSTVSGNSVTANGYGSGLFSTNMTLNNSTIAGNTGIGGIVVAGSSGSNFVLRSTLVANNTGPGQDIECPGGNCTVTGDTSLVRAPGVGVTLAPGTIVGQDPLLGPLANNGGPVAGAPGDEDTAAIRTMRPQGNSPVLDRGSNPDGLEFDQRGPGFPRVLGSAPDIGALEVGGSGGGAAPVPMLGAWPLAALSALLGVLGWRARRRSG
jgi:hypothetical protein